MTDLVTGGAEAVSRAMAGARPDGASQPLRLARPVLFGSGAMLVALGVLIWTGNGNGLRLIHDVLGVTFVVALWRVAAVAARLGASQVWVAVTVVWGLAILTLGLVQKELLVGDWHWSIQFVHLVIGLGAMFWARPMASMARLSGPSAMRFAGSNRRR